MPNLLPTVFIALAASALALTLLWLWQSLRLAFVHTLAAPPTAAVSPERALLMAEKQSLLLALKDLEAERDAGKLSAADYAELNVQYRMRARVVLRELDGLLAPHRADAKALIEAAIGGRADSVAASSTAGPASTNVAGRPDVAVTAAEVSPHACGGCGTGNDVDAVFCKKCGARLRSEPSA
jgi:hypothetical protein